MPFLVVAMLVLAPVALPQAGATTVSTTVAHGGHPAVAQPCADEVPQNGTLQCRVDVRTAVATASGFDVQLGFGWIGAPTGMSASFDKPVIRCPASAGAACERVILSIHAGLDAWAPDAWQYNVYATRLCGGAPCDAGADTSYFLETVDVSRATVASLRCALGDRWPVYSNNVCTARFADAGGAGPASRPSSAEPVEWNIFFNTAKTECDLVPVPDTTDAAECSMSYYSNIPATESVIAFWPGDATYGSESVSMRAFLHPRATRIDASCPASVYAGDMATCDIAVVDAEAAPLRAGAPRAYGELLLVTATNMARSTGHLCDIVDGEPASCDLSFTPTGNATMGLAFDTNHLSYRSSAATVNVTRLLRPTVTTLACDPAFLPVGATTTCTAVVEDATADEAPLGTVDLSWGGSCALAPVPSSTRSSCGATFAPALTDVGTGRALAASYRGAGPHAGSADQAVVNVTKRQTTTDVSCAPSAFIPLFGPAPTPHCVAWVNDTSSGTPITPAGNVSWTSVPPESFETARDQGVCVLVEGRCGIDAVLPIGDQMLTGTYGGDAYHVAGVGGADLVRVHAQTALTYVGPRAVPLGSSFDARAVLASASALCALGRAADFTGVNMSLDRDPTGRDAGAHRLAGPLGTTSEGVASASVPTAGWRPGVYALRFHYGGDPYCDPSTATATLLVGDAASTASGAGRLVDLDTNVTFRIRGDAGSATGAIDVTNGTSWKLSGQLTSLVRASPDGTLTCAADGVGTLFAGVTDASGRHAWTSVGTVRFGTLFEDARPSAGRPGDRWTLEVSYLPRPGEPATLPGGALLGFSTGNVACR